MAHVAKYTRNATKNLTRHYERAKDKDGNYIKFGNQDIDTTKTHLNYNLAPDRGNQGEFIKKRCDEFNCVKRDNINVMCSWVVTVPKDLPENQEKEFFEQSYKFLRDRYGKENVVSAYVHNDESNPHMHYSFVPVVYDKKKEKYKVSAKDCVNRTDLQTFHKDLSKHMEHHFGHDVGILNEATKEGNKSIEELKRESATQKLELVKAKSEKIIADANTKASDMLQNAHDKVKKLKDDIEPLERYEKYLEGQIGGLKATLNTYHDIDQIGKKNLLGKITVSPEELKQLKTQAKAYLTEHNKRVTAEQYLENSQKMNKRIVPLRDELKETKKELWDKDLKLRKTKTQLQEFKEVLDSNPQLKKAFNLQKDILQEEQRQRNIKMNNDYEIEL